LFLHFTHLQHTTLKLRNTPATSASILWHHTWSKNHVTVTHRQHKTFE